MDIDRREPIQLDRFEQAQSIRGQWFERVDSSLGAYIPSADCGKESDVGANIPEAGARHEQALDGSLNLNLEGAGPVELLPLRVDRQSDPRCGPGPHDDLYRPIRKDGLKSRGEDSSCQAAAAEVGS